MGEILNIKKGTQLVVHHSRYGKFRGVASQDFDTRENWYPVLVADGELVQGASRAWGSGDAIPCRRSVVLRVEVAA